MAKVHVVCSATTERRSECRVHGEEKDKKGSRLRNQREAVIDHVGS